MNRNRLPVLILHITSIYIGTQTFPAYSAKTYSINVMAGTISALSKKSKIMSIGDNVKIKIDADIVVQGDRLSVFETLRDSQHRKSEDVTDKPLLKVGEVAVTGIRGKNVYGEIISASREIVNGSFVSPVYSTPAGPPEFISFLKKIASSRLKNPVEDMLNIGITETVNETGDVTRATAEVSREFRDAVCNRVQFNCAHPRQIKATLSKYGIATSESIGKVIRQKLNLEAGVDILITSKVENLDNGKVVVLVAWDLKSEMKSKPQIIPSQTRAGSDSEYQGEVLEKFLDIRHGSLKITLNNSDFSGVRRVDYLQTVEMEDIIYKRFMPDISAKLPQSIAWKDITVTLAGERYSATADGTVYEGIVTAKTHFLVITATPVLSGDPSVVVGKPLEESFELEIFPDTAIHTEIILKTRGKKAILIVDSVPEI
jgi:hypothetical protein